MPADEAAMNQLALNLKRQGQSQVACKNSHWLQSMRVTARNIIVMRGQVTSDDLHDAAERMGMVPTHPNAWGAVFANGFKRIGFTRSRREQGRGRLVSIWGLD